MMHAALKRPRWRFSLIVLGIVGLLGSALWVHAQSSPLSGAPSPTASRVEVRTITANSAVAVRGGPSEKFFITGYLHRGQKVQVVGESERFPGWLEIKPPVGSFSWINSMVVKRYGNYIGTVVADSAIPTRIGSQVTELRGQVGNVENKRKLARGTLLVLLDDTNVTSKDGVWLPIAPTPGEVRYIPASAVKGSRAESTTLVSNGPGSPGYLIAKADQAFQGRYVCQATHLYLEAAHRTRDYREKTYCYNQLDRLEKMGGGIQACTKQPGYPRYTSTPRSNNNNPFRVASHSTTSYREQRQPKSQIGSRLRAALNPTAQPRWSRWGILKTTLHRHPNGQPIYMLTDGQDNVLAYATTTPELHLRDYIGKLTCLYGTTQYLNGRRDFRNNYVMVTHVSIR